VLRIFIKKVSKERTRLGFFKYTQDNDSVDFRKELVVSVGKTPEDGSSNTVIITGDGTLAVLNGTERIPLSDMVAVLLLLPSYHFPEFSRRT
jgi:hypothetical protein